MMKRRPSSGARDFLLGVIWGAWFLHSSLGEDTYAEELLATAGRVDELQRLARAEGYVFKRGFWAELRRHENRRLAHV